MLSQFTLTQVVVFFLSAAGIAVLLSRVPGWDAWGSAPGADPRIKSLKALIVTGLNVLASIFLAVYQVYVPPQVGNQTLDQLLVGLFMAAASFVVHTVDAWLTAQKQVAQANAVLAHVAPAHFVGETLRRS